MHVVAEWHASVPKAIWLNDVHSKLNWTPVRQVETPRGLEDLRSAVEVARNNGLKISCAGGRHAMGGQQFGTGNLHLDLCDMNGLLSFDPERGLVDVEAGMQWPQLIGTLTKMQEDRLRALGIRGNSAEANRRGPAVHWRRLSLERAWARAADEAFCRRCGGFQIDDRKR